MRSPPGGTKEFDLLFLAQAQFAKPVGDFRRGGELFDADHRAGLHAAEGANRYTGAATFQYHV